MMSAKFWVLWCGFKVLKFLGSARTLPFRKTTRHSLFVAVLAIRYLPFAVVWARQEPRPPKFSALQKNHLLFATCHSLPFRVSSLKWTVQPVFGFKPVTSFP